MELFIKRINESAFNDYSNNKSSIEETNNLTKIAQEEFEINLDQDYLTFLTKLNGFELNGLNFYGTEEQSNLYVLNVLLQNEFWRMELPSLSKYFIVGDGDMDFYCFDPEKEEFKVLTKGSLHEIETYVSFEKLMSELLNIYG